MSRFVHHLNPTAMSAFGSAVVLQPGIHPKQVTMGGVQLVRHGQLDNGREVWHHPNRQRGLFGDVQLQGGNITQPVWIRTSKPKPGDRSTTSTNTSTRPRPSDNAPRTPNNRQTPALTQSGSGSNALLNPRTAAGATRIVQAAAHRNGMSVPQYLKHIGGKLFGGAPGNGFGGGGAVGPMAVGGGSAPPGMSAAAAGAIIPAAIAFSGARDDKQQRRAYERYLNTPGDLTSISDGVGFKHNPDTGRAYVTGLPNQMDPSTPGGYAMTALANNPFASYAQQMGGYLDGAELRNVDDPVALQAYLEQRYAPTLQWAQSAPRFTNQDHSQDDYRAWLAANPPPGAPRTRYAMDRTGQEFAIHPGQSVPNHLSLIPNNGYGYASPVVRPFDPDQRWGEGVTTAQKPQVQSFESFRDASLQGYKLTPMQQWEEYNAYKAKANPGFTVGGKTPTSQHLTQANLAPVQVTQRVSRPSPANNENWR